MARIRLLISYDGTDFCGWQLQAAHQPTVQGALEKALEKIFHQKIRVHSSGRTDAGVHAVGQVCHFDAPREVSTYNFIKALNRWVPDSIAILKAWEAPKDFHSLFSAETKTYKYLILNRAVPSALRRRYTWWLRQPLDFDSLQELSPVLVGEQDFKSFQTAGTVLKTGTVRTIFEANWRRVNRDVLEFTITGNGFLKQMVRNIVGTLVDLSQRSEGPEVLKRILEAQDRREARTCAPAQGLYLYRVSYPQALDKKCRKL